MPTIAFLTLSPVVIGRFFLDNVSWSPVHDIYSHVTGAVIMLKGFQLYWTWSSASAKDRDWKRLVATSATACKDWISDLTVTILVGLLLQMYVFSPFQGNAPLSLRSAVAYGVFTRYLVKQARQWNEPHEHAAINANRPVSMRLVDRLSERLSESTCQVEVRGHQAPAPVNQADNLRGPANAPPAASVRAIASGTLLLLLPGLLASAYIHAQVTFGIYGHVTANSVVNACIWSRLLVASIVSAKILYRPAKRMFLRWRRAVWESEYIVKVGQGHQLHHSPTDRHISGTSSECGRT